MVNNKNQETSAQPVKSRWKTALVKLVVLAALVAAGYSIFKNPQIIDQLRQMAASKPAADIAPQAVDYQSQLDGLNTQIVALQNQLQMAQVNPATAPEVDLTAVNEKLSALEKNNLNIIDSKADIATVLGLITRMDKAEDRLDKMVKVTDEGALLLTATMLVKDSASQGGNFEYEMEVLKQIAANNQQIKEPLAIMDKYAHQGIEPAGQLKKEFGSVYARINKEQKDAFDKTWTDRLNSKLSEIVQIKRVNQDAPQFVADQGLEKAKQAIKFGDLSAAVAELEKPENIKLLDDANLKKWLDAAKANVEFNQAVNRITAGSLAMLKVNMLKQTQSDN